LIHKKLEIEGLSLHSPELVIKLGKKRGNLKVYLEAFKRLLQHVPLINLKAQGGLLRIEKENVPSLKYNTCSCRLRCAQIKYSWSSRGRVRPLRP